MQCDLQTDSIDCYFNIEKILKSINHELTSLSDSYVKDAPSRVSSLASIRQLGNKEEIRQAQIYFDDCYMSFKVRLWHNIDEPNCIFHKGMRHIFFTARWQSSLKKHM